MQSALTFVTIAVMAGIVLVLGLGLWNMFRGGSGNTSQRLMRARVILQAVALALLLGALFLFGNATPG